jgi:hypothetical protein
MFTLFIQTAHMSIATLNSLVNVLHKAWCTIIMVSYLVTVVGYDLHLAKMDTTDIKMDTPSNTDLKNI